jgi:hypothetical protein
MDGEMVKLKVTECTGENHNIATGRIQMGEISKLS